MTTMTNAAPKPWWALLLIVAGNLASTGLVGCGGITEVSSGLAPETLGQDLTAEELDQLCRAVDDYAGRHAWDETAVCRLLGIVSVSQTEDSIEDARLVCQSAYDSCRPRGGAADTFCLNVDPSTRKRPRSPTEIADRSGRFSAHLRWGLSPF